MHIHAKSYTHDNHSILICTIILRYKCTKVAQTTHATNHTKTYNKSCTSSNSNANHAHRFHNSCKIIQQQCSIIRNHSKQIIHNHSTRNSKISTHPIKSWQNSQMPCNFNHIKQHIVPPYTQVKQNHSNQSYNTAHNHSNYARTCKLFSQVMHLYHTGFMFRHNQQSCNKETY